MLCKSLFFFFKLLEHCQNLQKHIFSHNIYSLLFSLPNAILCLTHCCKTALSEDLLRFADVIVTTFTSNCASKARISHSSQISSWFYSSHNLTGEVSINVSRHPKKFFLEVDFLAA